MRGLNETFGRSGTDEYATAIVLSVHRVTGRLAFSNAGHLPPLWYHAAQGTWGWLERRELTRTPKKSQAYPSG